jgi:hypothetical protein
MVIAVLETSKDSACKTKLMKRLKRVTSLYFCNLFQRPRDSCLCM